MQLGKKMKCAVEREIITEWR